VTVRIAAMLGCLLVVGACSSTSEDPVAFSAPPDPGETPGEVFDEIAGPLGPGETPGEVFLELAGSLGPDPFTGEVFSAPVVATTAPLAALPSTTTTAATGEAAPVVISSLRGDSPGLYGGTEDNARCNKDAILLFLEQNPDKAAAWVEAQNTDATLRWGEDRTSLTVADLGAYFEELTPVTLLFDTRVTNNGFRDGRPTPRQSVLQEGTAVLVDRWGVLRSRCGCGNPLTPPLPSPVPPSWVGSPWPGFDPTSIVVVGAPDTAITQITISNINTGGIIVRPVGTTGDQDTVEQPATTDTTPPTTPTDTTPPTTPEESTCEQGEMVLLIDTGNRGGIEPGAASAPTFVTFDTPVCLTRIRDYHWNGGEGAPAGTVSLAADDGTTHGPWEAEGCAVSMSFDDACTEAGGRYWIVDLMLELPAGTYEVLDSDPATWAHNADSGGAGHTLMWGYQLGGDEPESGPQNTSISLVRDGATIDVVAEGMLDNGYCSILATRFSILTGGPIFDLDDGNRINSWTILLAIAEGFDGAGVYEASIGLTDNTYFAETLVFDETQKKTYEATAPVTVTMPDGFIRVEFAATVSGDAGTADLAGVFVCRMESGEDPVGDLVP